MTGYAHVCPGFVQYQPSASVGAFGRLRGKTSGDSVVTLAVALVVVAAL